MLFKRTAVTITHEGAGSAIPRTHRMLPLYLSILFILPVLSRGNRPLGIEPLHNHRTQTTEPDVEQIRSPLLEVFMQLPRNLRDVDQPDRLKRNADRQSLVEVRQYEIKQPIFIRDPNDTSDIARSKREAKEEEAKKSEPQKLVSALTGSGQKKDRPMLPVADAIRGPIFKTYPVKEFDVVDIDDPDDPRRRRTDSSNDEDNSQRDKRTFLEEGSGETTTALPFWKRKKENPPFVTGRVGSGAYTPAQHRSGESSKYFHGLYQPGVVTARSDAEEKPDNFDRESHSLKNPSDKTVQSNEISRSNQDSYYSSTNRRTYSRQYDGPTSSTPKSVYDTIDYSTKPNSDPGRGEFTRNQEEKEPPRERRPQTHEQYSNRQPNPPWMYDRPYYQPAYPYPTEILGRGVEYYHRTYDPTTGRIIYYANMPDQGRSYEYRYMDPISRSFYLTRPYRVDPYYYRNYVPPFDYRFVNGFGRPGEYIRHGRSGSQAYSYPYQDREKFSRDGRFVGGFETGNRLKDDLRNRTYIIYDADESRSQFSRPQHAADNNRLAQTPASGNNPSRPQFPLQQFPFSPPPEDYFPPPAFPNRNNFYSPVPAWGFSHRSLFGVTDSKSDPNSRPLHSPEVQLPLTAAGRGDLNKSKKS